MLQVLSHFSMPFCAANVCSLRVREQVRVARVCPSCSRFIAASYSPDGVRLSMDRPQLTVDSQNTYSHPSPNVTIKGQMDSFTLGNVPVPDDCVDSLV